MGRLFSASKCDQHEKTLETAKLLCADGHLSNTQLLDAVDYAQKCRVPLPDVLSSLYGVSGFTWARARAGSSGLPLADLMKEAPDKTLIHEEDRAAYLRLFFIPWRRLPNNVILIAARDPDDPAIERLMHQRYPDATFQYAVTGKFDVIWTVQRLFEDVLSEDAKEALFNSDPELSAKTTVSNPQIIGFLM